MKQIIINLPCKAFITTGYFENTGVLKTHLHKGVITEFNKKSKYVKWNIKDIEQPVVNINCVSFIL